MFDLFPISKLVADAGLMMGGSEFLFYRAMFCPYIRPDGTPCYNERDGSAWIECPVCKSTGTVYQPPRRIKGVYTDNSNKWIPDGSGGFMRGDKTLSLPRELDLRLLRERVNNPARRVLRNKFVLLERCCGGKFRAKEVLFQQDDPTMPTVSSGTVYQILTVANNY